LAWIPYRSSESLRTGDKDRERFLDTFAEACEKTGWQAHAYCLMSNHFHLLLETPQSNLLPVMKWFLGTYTSRYNRRHKEFAHLFGGRYQALAVEGSGDGYLMTVGDYVHLNPARAGLLAPEQPLSSFPWSRSGLGALGGTSSARNCWRRSRSSPRPSHFGEAVQEAVEASGARLMLATLRKAGWTESDLRQRRKSGGRKLEVARLDAPESSHLGSPVNSLERNLLLS
jgi:REP element-mobilizing transposase RayT